MRTIDFVTHNEGLNFSFKQDDVGNRTYTLDWEKEDGYYVPENFNLEDDEKAKKFLHGLIDGFFEKRNEQAESSNGNLK